MDVRSYNASRVFLARLRKGDDLLAAVEELCRAQGVSCGLISVIGSVSRATLAYYLQEERAYRAFTLEGPLEVVSGSGNVSLKEGEPFCHLHLVLSDARGAACGGHLAPGTSVFAAEVHLLELSGTPPVRQPDEDTGLNLWRFPAEAPPQGGGERWKKPE